MDSANQELKHRRRDEPITDNVERQKRPSTAKRGITSLFLALALPLSLTLAETVIASSGYNALALPWWFPPLWTLHVALLLYSGLMAASAWLVWNQDSTAVVLYVAHLVVSLAWAPVASENALGGFILGVVTTVLVAVSYNRYGNLNRMARQLILPCLIWAVFLALGNLRLVFLRL